MTTIYNKLTADFMSARKAKDKMKIALLSTINGELYNEALRVGVPVKNIPDDITIATLKKFSKNLDELIKHDQDNIDAFEEKKVVDSYIPSQMSETDLEIVVGNFVKETGKNTVKDIMAFLKAHFAGKYDGKIASAVAKGFAS